MANLILASKREVKSGSQMWHVYRLSENTKSDEFFFAQPIKALRYAFLLRKRSGFCSASAAVQSCPKPFTQN